MCLACFSLLLYLCRYFVFPSICSALYYPPVGHRQTRCVSCWNLFNVQILWHCFFSPSFSFFFFAADDKCNQPVIVCAIYERWIVLRTCKPFCEPLYLCYSSYDYQASLVNWKVQAANIRNAQINAIEYICLPLIDVPMFEMRTLFNLITFLSFLVLVCLAFIFHFAK